MKKNIKCFLFTSLFLGFLQLESSAMEEADNNKAAIRQTNVQERRETDERVNSDLSRIREDASSFGQEIGIRITQESTRIESILSRLQQQNEENTLLIKKVMEENINLRKIVLALQEQLSSSRHLRAIFSHSMYGKDGGWAPYTNANWAPITFDHFQGDESLRGNLSTIEIPEDGVYSLLAHYLWRVNGIGVSAPYTGIAINTFTNFDGCVVQPHIDSNRIANGTLTRVTFLKKNDKVMVSVFGQPNAEYCLHDFKFVIEKLH